MLLLLKKQSERRRELKQTFIITGGKIFTSDEEGLYADSMIVEDGVITWIGAEAELPVKDCPSIDLAGKRVLPGFVDAHMHSVILADFSRQISCLPPKVHSIEARLAERAASKARISGFKGGATMRESWRKSVPPIAMTWIGDARMLRCASSEPAPISAVSTVKRWSWPESIKTPPIPREVKSTGMRMENPPEF